MLCFSATTIRSSELIDACETEITSFNWWKLREEAITWKNTIGFNFEKIDEVDDNIDDDEIEKYSLADVLEKILISTSYFARSSEIAMGVFNTLLSI